MNTVAVLKQLVIIFNTKVFGKRTYPVAEMFQYWKSYVTKDGKTEYEQVATLKAYLAK